MSEPTSHSGDAPPPDADQASKTASYPIGYGRPPTGRRFPKGRSGNPQGRRAKKPAGDLRLIVDEFFAEPVKVRQRGKTKTMTKLESHVELQLAAALRGDVKAAMSLFDAASKTGQFSKAEHRRGPVIGPAGTPEDQRLLRVFHANNDCDRQGPTADEAMGFPKFPKPKET